MTTNNNNKTPQRTQQKKSVLILSAYIRFIYVGMLEWCNLEIKTAVAAWMRSVPCRLMCWNHWSQICGAVWGGYGTLCYGTLLEEVCPKGGPLKVLPHFYFTLCFLHVGENEISLHKLLLAMMCYLSIKKWLVRAFVMRYTACEYKWWKLTSKTEMQKKPVPDMRHVSEAS